MGRRASRQNQVRGDHHHAGRPRVPNRAGDDPLLSLLLQATELDAGLCRQSARRWYAAAQVQATERRSSGCSANGETRMNSGQITVENGVISYTLDKEYTGNGTERIGYGNAPNGPQPHVTFYAKQAQHGAASLDQGKPVFKSIVFMRLQHPGERDVYEQPARPSDAERFPREYRHYCSGRVGIPDGAPLQVLFPNHEDVVSNLQYHRIYTVEQLANLSDTALQNIGMGGLEWQGKARRWLDAVKGGGGFAQLEENQRKLQVDNTRLRDQNQQMTSQLQALTNQIAQLTN